MTRTKKPRRGRPPLGDAGLSRVVSIKVSEAIRARWVAAAKREGVTLGAWLRSAAELRAGMVIDRP